jgi:hypothetical protein
MLYEECRLHHSCSCPSPAEYLEHTSLNELISEWIDDQVKQWSFPPFIFCLVFQTLGKLEVEGNPWSKERTPSGCFLPTMHTYYSHETCDFLIPPCHIVYFVHMGNSSNLLKMKENRTVKLLQNMSVGPKRFPKYTSQEVKTLSDENSLELTSPSIF